MAANRFVTKWNRFMEAWVVDIYESDGTTLVLGGIGLVTGADLLRQYGYLGLGGQMIAQTDHDTDAVPTFENLGGEGHLYYLSP